MTATLIPFPPRLLDLQPFSERECSDFLFNPAPHSLAVSGGIPGIPTGDAASAKSRGIATASVERGGVVMPVLHRRKSPEAATNSDHRDPSIAVKAAGAGVSSSTPAPATLYSPWSVSKAAWWR